MADSRLQEVSESEDRLGMTDASWAQRQEYTHGYGEQDANGIDLLCLCENLRLSPTERLRKHQRALKLVTAVRIGDSRSARASSEVSRRQLPGIMASLCAEF